MLVLKSNQKKVKKECLHYLSHPGAVLLMPTETVYGLVCRWDDTEAVNRIRSMKGRDADKPFQMLASDLGSVEEAGIQITRNIKKVSAAFCPGPITIIAKKTDKHQTVGFRIPDHDLMLEILSSYGANFAATSANYTGLPPAETIDDALSSLNGEPDMVVDAGPVHGQASTVVDMTGCLFKILRQGPISKSAISKVLL